MLCQSCQTNQATILVKKSYNGTQTEIHLCQECAMNSGEVFAFSNPLDFQQIIFGMMNNKSLSDQVRDRQKQELSCPTCQLTMAEFSKVGKFGCGACYTTFQESLPLILKNTQGGYSAHQGRQPKQSADSKPAQAVDLLAELKQKLQAYIHEEKFELAAEVRDKIRVLEADRQEADGNV